MAQKKSSRKSARSNVKRASSLFGLPLSTWISSIAQPRAADLRSGKRAFVFAFGTREGKLLKKVAGAHLSRWQMQMCLESEAEVQFFQGTSGPVWILRLPVLTPQASPAALEKSGYARFRDAIGPIVSQLQNYASARLILETVGLTKEEERGLLVGLEMASYFYQEHRAIGKRKRRELPAVFLRSNTELAIPKPAAPDAKAIREASSLGLSVNIARHLVNLPPNDLNPRSYAGAIESLFAGSATVEVEIWEGERLQKERMNLLLAVGGAAAEGPRFVHLKYRPRSSSALKPVAIVGKGVTFDSGGLDIKPASGMRWMKKDMGGSAAVVALAKWAELVDLGRPVDFYVSLAENAVGSRAFRPGDIVTARSGMTVEIQNTDAEGRLVLADALDVAAVGMDGQAPEAIINVATLTGANKVALGSEIAGLYSNDDDLSRRILDSGLERGDLAWRIPLYQPYRSQLKSTFADCQNSADGFGGAITAALFLESFVRKIPFAHLDIYAWRDAAGGAFSEMGGNGQSVQGLAEVLKKMEVTGEELA